MKNINKSNIMGLIGMDVINIKNEEVGTVVGYLNGKYIINVYGEEKFYSESTLIKNWKIAEEEIEEISTVSLLIQILIPILIIMLIYGIAFMFPDSIIAQSIFYFVLIVSKLLEEER